MLLNFIKILGWKAPSAITFYIVDFISIGLLSPIGLIGLLINSKNTTINEYVVILIHGTGVSDWQWGVAKAYLYFANIGFKSVKYNYAQSITKSSDDIMEQIPQNKKIILIGHSQGGLIARNIANRINTKKLFLLNSPQKGTKLLNELYPNEYNHECSYKDMKRDSNFIENLPQVNDANTVYEIVGLNDFIDYNDCIVFNKNVYKSWFGHYFSAVNPYLWIKYIIPNIGNPKN